MIDQVFSTGSLRWIFEQAFLNEVTCLKPSDSVQSLIAWLLLQNLLVQSFVIMGIERIISQEQPISDASDSPDINHFPMLSDIRVNKFWRHVVWCPKAQLQRLRVIMERSCEAKVSDFDSRFVWIIRFGILQQDIVRL